MDHLFEVWVSLVAFNLLRLQLSSCTLDLHLRVLHLKEVHSLQVPQTPEQHLNAQKQRHRSRPISQKSTLCICVTSTNYVRPCVPDLNPESLQHRSHSFRDQVKIVLFIIVHFLRVHVAGKSGLQVEMFLVFTIFDKFRRTTCVSICKRKFLI